MPYVFAKDSLIFFAHVPKAAGGTVENYLTERFGPLSLLSRDWDQVRVDNPEACRVSPQHMSAEMVVRYLPRTPDWSFAVVRNPYSRLSSEHRMHLNARRSRKYLARFGYEFHANLLLSAAERDPCVFDNHVRPQTDIVPAGADVFRMEDGIEELIEVIEHKYGKPQKEINLGDRYVYKHEACSVPSKRLVRRMQLFYADDFRQFDYSTEYSCRETTLSDWFAAVFAACIAPFVAKLDSKARL